MEYDMDSDLPLSLMQHFGAHVDIIDLLGLYQEDINDLFYYDKSTSLPIQTCVRRTAKRKIELFIGFAQHKYDMGFTTFDNWLNFTYEHFLVYCGSMRLKPVPMSTRKQSSQIMGD